MLIRSPDRVLFLALLLSGALHAGLHQALSGRKLAKRGLPRFEPTTPMELVELPVPATVAAVSVVAEAATRATKQGVRGKAVRRSADNFKAGEDVDQRPADDTVVRFDGGGLSNEPRVPTPAQAMPGEVGARSSIVARAGVAAAGGRAGAGMAGSGAGDAVTERVVALANLSRRPQAPDLNEVLERNYPKRARLQGVEGLAVVRARIASSGKVASLLVQSESIVGYEFGEACRKTLRDSQWTPPLDMSGRRVATDIFYRCEFRVRY